MPAFNFDLKTYYDAEEKIWMGERFKPHYHHNVSIGQILYEEMRRRPNKICQISDTENITLTNAEALQMSINVANYFRAQGITQHDIIGLVARNTSYVMVVLLACFFNGTAFHAISPYRDEGTMRSLLMITKPKLIFFDAQDYERMQNVTKDIETSLITLKDRIPAVPTILNLLHSNICGEPFEPAELELGAAQNLAILCSSGSTGLPKAVTISNNKRLFDFCNFLADDDVTYVSATMDWLSGVLNLIASIVYGATRIIADVPFSPDYCLELVQKYKVTVVIQAPPQIAMLLNCPALSAEKLDSIRYYIYGGGKCPANTQQRLKSFVRNGILIYAYGFTEFGRIITTNFKFSEKPNSSGRVLPGYRVKIVNAEGKSVGPGEVGEICSYHGEGWNGYYGNEDKGALTYDADGWFHSGDLGYFDEDQYLYVLERKKDMLKYLGYHYCPCEVEQVIEKIPDVLDCCVFGVFNELIGDVAAAAVVLEPGSNITAEDVVNFVRSQTEVKAKQLNAGAIIVKELPKLSSGKLNRKALLEEFMRLKNL